MIFDFDTIMNGAIGSVIGATIVFISSKGVGLSLSSIKKSIKDAEIERENWKTNKQAIRQEITNRYLFIILRFLFLANLFWVASEGLSFIAYYKEAEILAKSFSLIGISISLLFFYLGLGKILNYMSLQR